MSVFHLDKIRNVIASRRNCEDYREKSNYKPFFVRNAFIRNLYWDREITKKLSALKPWRLGNLYKFYFILLLQF